MGMNFSDWQAMNAMFNKPEKKKKREFTFGDYVRFSRKFKEFEKWMKDQEKKEEKKEEKLKTEHIMMVLIAMFPIIGPLYVAWLRSLGLH